MACILMLAPLPLIEMPCVIATAPSVSKPASLSPVPTNSSRAHSFTMRSTSTKVTSQHSTVLKFTKKVADLLALSDSEDAESKGAFLDHDETVGNKQDAAINSTPKNGARTTSSVCTSTSLVYYTYAKL